MEIRITEDVKEKVAWKEGKAAPLEPNTEVRKVSFEIWDGDAQIVRKQVIRFKSGTAATIKSAINARAKELQSSVPALTSIDVYVAPPPPTPPDFEFRAVGSPYMKDKLTQQRYKVVRNGVEKSLIIVEGANATAFTKAKTAKFNAVKAEVLAGEADLAAAMAIVA
jgi:hypothetical protein